MPRVSSSATASQTRARLLEAAVDVLAEQGMGSFTHRIVETRAGVYHGATTHFFGNRDDLIDAVFAHLFALNQQTAVSSADVPPDPYAVTDPQLIRAMLRGGVTALYSSRREALARYALVVHAAQHDRLQRSLGRWRHELVAQVSPVMAALNAANPTAAARVYVAGTDGLLLHAFSAPWPGVDGELDALADALLDGALAVR